MEIITRDEAASAGFTHYFTGVPCKHGHLDTRYTKTGGCSECMRRRVRAHSAANPEKKKLSDRQSYEKNHAKRLAGAKEWRDANPELMAKYKRDWYERNKPEPKPRVYIRKPKAEKVAAANEYFRERRKRDPLFKLSAYTRNMLRRVLRATGDVKKGSTRDILGYGADELKAHIESLFQPGMTWENYGDWHIDHKIPISLMTLFGVTEPELINALSNLQPMWAIDNLVKGNRSVCQ